MFNRELDYYGISSVEDRISNQGSLDILIRLRRQ
jgi:hypothetical protein